MRPVALLVMLAWSFVDHLCFLCLVFLMLLRLFNAALWSPAGKGLTFWLLLVMFFVFFVTFPCGILGQVWYLIVLFPDICHLSYFQRRFTGICEKYQNLMCWLISFRHGWIQKISIRGVLKCFLSRQHISQRAERTRSRGL